MWRRSLSGSLARSVAEAFGRPRARPREGDRPQGAPNGDNPLLAELERRRLARAAEIDRSLRGTLRGVATDPLASTVTSRSED